MAYSFEAEKQFLLQLAVGQFNRQYSRKINPSDCAIKSIRANYRCTHGYEVWTAQANDFLRLRFYFIMGDKTLFDPYRVETDETFLTQALGDEVYVMLGMMDQDYIDHDVYRFRWIGPSDEGDFFTFMSDEPIDFMTGEKVHFANGG